MSLRNLRAEESRAFLAQRDVPDDQHAAVIAFAQGHPLALSLVADAFDQQPDLQFDPAETPDVVGTLLQRFFETPLTPLQRTAVEASALVRHTTQPLLAAVAEEDAHALFGWLRGLSFIEADADGVYPHDLVRDVLAADLRWRDPDRFAALDRLVRRYYTAQLQDAEGPDFVNLLIDYLYLNRDNPIIQPFFRQLKAQWHDQQVLADGASEQDVAVLREAVRRHEGAASARIFEAWVGAQPDGLQVFRGADREPVGCLFTVAIERDPEPGTLVHDDPGLQGVRTFIEAQAPIRAGERALVFRYWFSCEAYQAVSPVQGLIFVETVRHYLRTPGLAFTALPCAEPALWEMVFAYADLQRLPTADFEVGERAYGVFGHDWRVRPPLQWLGVLAERGQAFQPAPTAQTPPVRTELLVLSEPDFAEAVKEALQAITNPDKLQANPLLRSRLVLDRAPDEPGYGGRARLLQKLIHEVAEGLQASPREAKFYRALQATYLDPAPTQERAAEALDLPFSTYRRHLRSGIESLTQALWQREVMG